MRSLLAVAEDGAITEAADRIGLSQPALSRRLQQLEDHFGAPLFVRSRRGVELTEIGRLVQAEAAVLVSRFNGLQERVRAHLNLDAGIVRIGGGATAVSFVLPDAIAAFQVDYPDIRFQVREAGSFEIATNVASGQLELGVVTLPVQNADLHIDAVMTDKVVLVARRGHPLTARRRVHRLGPDLREQAFVGFEAGSAIRQIIDRALREVGVQPHVVMELRSIPAILRMVASTGYLAFVSRASLAGQHDIVEIPTTGLSIARELGVIRRADVPVSPAAEAFARFLRERMSGP